MQITAGLNQTVFQPEVPRRVQRTATLSCRDLTRHTFCYDKFRQPGLRFDSICMYFQSGYMRFGMHESGNTVDASCPRISDAKSAQTPVSLSRGLDCVQKRIVIKT